ncbi:CyP450 monooxygenase [Trametes sanguinea]|nr:CyP450 monooxygenase [Trametes sanguinea]
MLSQLPFGWLPGVGLLVALLVVWICIQPSGRTRRLPPGPKPLPLIGNALDFPSKDLGQAFRDMTLKYGELVYLNVVGQPMVILGTHEAAVELFEKRSAIYSDRNESTMVSLTGWEWLMTTLSYGPWWRRHRRAFHQFFTPTALEPYGPMQELEAHRLAYRLVKDPEHFLTHIRRMFASSIARFTYGVEIPEDDDEYLVMAEEALESFNQAFIPGKYLVETFPVLRFLPSWFPGAKFQREAKVWKPRVHKLRDVPWEQALKSIREGTAPPSMTADLMQRVSRYSGAERAEEEVIARNVAAVAYAAGADTTLSAIQSFFLGMASFPEVQRKAREELDAVVGPHRLPTLADRESLPYLEAVTKECLRWKTVAPVGLPHRSTEDDEYQGYLIPKGTLVVANMWWYSHDPERFPEPDVFQPERFLKNGRIDPDAQNPADIAFGYGRRICPGRHFADASLFLSVATILHTLSITAPLGIDGQPVKLEGKMTTGVISYPEAFTVDIKPRGSWAEALLEESWQASH